MYLSAIACGLILGIARPEQTGVLEWALWPVLAALLYATFTQVPLLHLRDALSDPRFIKSAVVGNFVLLPLIAWGLMHLAPANPVIQLGVILVLLVPCTDWFITFTHLGGGDTKHAIAFSPISLLLQMAFLPFYLWLFLGGTFTVAGAQEEMLTAFFGIILLPLAGAFVTEKWLEQVPRGGQLREYLAWLPVPLLGLVVFIIAATQVNLVIHSLDVLGQLLFVFACFLVTAGLLARGLARWFGLPVRQGRALAFSLGTRNSFVVLPLALALPPEYALAVVAIVFQSLVELLGMIIYLWWIPKRLFPLPDEKDENMEQPV